MRELRARLLAALALVALGLSLPACGDASEAVAPAPRSETVTVTVTEPAPPPPPPQPSVPTDDDSPPAETETTGYEGDFPAPRSTKHKAKAFELGAASAERPLRDLEAFEDLVRTCDVATRSLGGRTLRVLGIRDDDADRPPVLVVEDLPRAGH